MKGADLPAARAVRGHCQAHRKEERERVGSREGGRERERICWQEGRARAG